MTALLEMEDVRVSFGGLHAVAGMSLSLEAGRLHGLVGPNGSGKTTLLNAISRVGPLTSGTIRFAGRDIRAVPGYELGLMGLARTFQSIRLIPTLTVRENVLVGSDQSATRQARGSGSRLTAGRRGTQLSARLADQALKRLEISDVARELPGTLSYGTQRRVEIARALAGGPQLLLLDEPVAGMNHAERQEIGRLLRSLRDGGVTLLLIEHDLRMLLELCDDLSVMDFGKCIATGNPVATAALPIVQEAYMGKSHVVA